MGIILLSFLKTLLYLYFVYQRVIKGCSVRTHKCSTYLCLSESFSNLYFWKLYDCESIMKGIRSLRFSK